MRNGASLAINANVLTDYVKANGMGGIDSARFSAAIKQLSETYDYKAAPDAALYFTDAYLPAGGFPVRVQPGPPGCIQLSTA